MTKMHRRGTLIGVGKMDSREGFLEEGTSEVSHEGLSRA